MTMTMTMAGLAMSVSVASSDPCTEVVDAAGDAVVRRTDPGNDGALHGLSVLPDIVRMSACGWEAFSPSSDPFTGQTVEGERAHLFRLTVEFAGLVNPAGRVLGANPDPFAFGPSPLIGFIDVDVDHRNSGGELGAAAESRYLANVARFGIVPEGSIADRVALSRDDVDNNFYTTPQYERTGADFALVFCGCDMPTVVAEGGDGDGAFEAGETWVVRSRLFERAQGYAEASAATGGSAPGLYDPMIDVQFSHEQSSDRTTVTVVWALDMIGAAALAGGSVQSIDYRVDNHTSVIEALSDIIEGATIGGFSGPGWTLVERWEGRDADDYLDPSDWEITGLVGLPYLSTAEGLYAWTDTAGDEREFGDCDGDGFINSADEALVRGQVYDNDGTATDADGVLDGVWTLINPGFNFSLYDLNGDMAVGGSDIAELRPLGDFDFNGTVNTQDFIAFLNAWVAREATADFDLNQTVNTQDFIAFLNAWVGG
ncbi:MAG: GC-type dockerin domain-anchored protein [Phycisphaerales bacterium JB054]